MGSPPAPHTVAILEILSDGQWHTRDELIAKAGVKIPPGRAVRKAEGERSRQRARPTKSGKTLRRPEFSDDHTIAVGRKLLVGQTLSNLSGLEHKIEHGTRWVRRPGAEPKEPHHH